MLERIEIRNFQSHKATNFDLSPMVNTMQGNSDCGKSAVLRALNWLIFNPAGDYFVSDWAKKGKKISAPCEVTVFVDGHKITRRRDSDFNGYILDDQVFEATRNSVPDQILKVLGLGEVNLQKQLDAPFLLSMSPGDVSRYVNSLVNLSRIDIWTTGINGRTRKLMQEVESCEQRVTAARIEVESYSWVPALEELSEEISALEISKSEISDNLEKLKSSISSHDSEVEKLLALPDVDKALELLNSASALNTKQLELSAEINSLSEQIANHDKQSEIICSLPDLDMVEKLLSEASDLDMKAEKIKTRLMVMSCEINKYLEIKVPEVPEEIFSLLEKLERYKNVRTRLEENISALRQELGTYTSNSILVETAEKEIGPILWELDKMVCPICGRKGLHED